MKNKKAFSLVEAIIMITVFAIVIAVATPMISRKIVNTADVGASLGGANHGRYEFFTKEVFKIPTAEDGPEQLWERTIDTTKKDGIIVYERKTDADYIRLKPGEPLISSDNYKSTMYEEITDVKPQVNDKGEIISATKNGVVYYKGGRFIFENKNLVYKKVNDDYTRKECGFGENCTLDKDKYRIIEGNLTQYFKDNPDTGNKLFLIEVNAGGSTPPGFTIPVTSVPWERIYSGEDPIIDRLAPTDPTTGNPIGEFKIKDKIKNLTIHATGAGGAGGVLNDEDLNGVIYTKTGMGATNADILKMQKILAQRIRDVALRKGTCYIDNVNMCEKTSLVCTSLNMHGCPIPNRTDEQLVGYGTKDYSIDYDDWQTYDSTLDGKWAYINTSKGTIHVKADTRFGLIFPHDLLDYTIELGAQTQDSVVYEMPRWFDFSNVNDKKFWLIETVTSGEGGDAGTMRVNSSNSSDCLIPHYVNQAGSSCYGPYQHCHGTLEEVSCCTSAYTTSTGVETCGSWGTCTVCNGQWRTDQYRCHCESASCGGEGSSYFSCLAKQSKWTYCCGGECCPGSWTREHPYIPRDSSKIYKHFFPGGLGGDPSSATTCMKAEDYPIKYLSTCGRKQGAKGKNGEDVVHSYSQSSCRPTLKTAQGGKVGQDCKVEFTNKNDTHWAIAYGGKGGHPYGGLWNVANQTTVAELDVSVSNGGEGPHGQKGSASGSNYYSGSLNCAEAKGGDSDTGIHNYAFIWSIPFAMNTLTYGESGQEGSCETLKINGLTQTQSLKISLGVGGKWSDDNGNGKIDINDFKNTKGTDGTDTTIDLLENGAITERILTAKGGKGGNSSYKTDAYDLCFAQEGICHKDSSTSVDPNVNCCINEKNSRDTKEIISSNIKDSLFENLKSLVGKNEIVGIGLGRGAEGAGTRAGLETVYGQRKAHNPTGANLNASDRTINSVTINKSTTKADYKNKLLIPSEFNFKGGDGAVIITW